VYKQSFCKFLEACRAVGDLSEHCDRIDIFEVSPTIALLLVLEQIVLFAGLLFPTKKFKRIFNFAGHKVFSYLKIAFKINLIQHFKVVDVF